MAALRGSLAAVLVAVAGWWTVTSLMEAYGAGPPYYGRSANMDKWENPVPVLVVVDLGALALGGVLLRPLVRRRQRLPTQE